MNTFTHVFQFAPKLFSAFMLSAVLMFTIPLASADTGMTKQSTASQSFAKVNLNQASVKELSTVLTGIGQSKAEAIVAYREKHGGFKDLNDLLKVKGIGKKTLEKNKAKMSL